MYGLRQSDVSAMIRDAPSQLTLVMGRPEDSASFNKLLSEAIPKQKADFAQGKVRTRLVSKDIYLPKSVSTSQNLYTLTEESIILESVYFSFILLRFTTSKVAL